MWQQEFSLHRIAEALRLGGNQLIGAALREKFFSSKGASYIPHQSQDQAQSNTEPTAIQLPTTP